MSSHPCLPLTEREDISNRNSQAAKPSGRFHRPISSLPSYELYENEGTFTSKTPLRVIHILSRTHASEASLRGSSSASLSASASATSPALPRIARTPDRTRPERAALLGTLRPTRPPGGNGMAINYPTLQSSGKTPQEERGEIGSLSMLLLIAGTKIALFASPHAALFASPPSYCLCPHNRGGVNWSTLEGYIGNN